MEASLRGWKWLACRQKPTEIYHYYLIEWLKNMKSFLRQPLCEWSSGQWANSGILSRYNLNLKMTKATWLESRFQWLCESWVNHIHYQSADTIQSDNGSFSLSNRMSCKKKLNFSNGCRGCLISCITLDEVICSHTSTFQVKKKVNALSVEFSHDTIDTTLTGEA